MKRTILAAAILLAGITAASAVDFSQTIRGLDGKPVTVSDIDKTPVTLGSVAEVALIAPGGSEPLTPEEKSRRFFLALKIHEGKGDRLTVEELALVKKVIGSVYGPLVYGRAVEIIDGRLESNCPGGDCGGGGGGPAYSSSGSVGFPPKSPGGGGGKIR
jgi:hypothetical protein